MSFFLRIILIFTLMSPIRTTFGANSNVPALMDLSVKLFAKNIEYMKQAPMYKTFGERAESESKEILGSDNKSEFRKKYISYLTTKFGLSDTDVESNLQPELIEAVRNELEKPGSNRQILIPPVLGRSEFDGDQFAITKLILLDMFSYLRPDSIKAAVQAESQIKRNNGKPLSLPFPLCAIFRNCKS